MWYTQGYEISHFYPTAHRRRTAPDPGRIAFVRYLCLAPLPDLVRFCSPRTSAPDCSPGGLRRPGGAQRDPWLQCPWTCGSAPGIVASPSATHLVHGRGTGALARPVAPQPTRIRQRAWHLDAGIGGPGLPGTRHHRGTDFRRERAPRPQATENQLEARQTLDYQPRSVVPAKKNARDHLIAWA